MTAEIGKRVAELREGMGMSQQLLGKLVGISQQAIDLIEGGQRSPSIATTAKLASALKCGLVDLLSIERGMLDLTFPVEPGVELGQLADLEQRVAEAVDELLPGSLGSTVSVWPWVEATSDRGLVRSTALSVIRLRVLPSVVSTASTLRAVAGARLRQPTVAPARVGETLRVLVCARSMPDARAEIVGEANAVGATPSVRPVARRPLGGSSAWLCTVLGVSTKGAEILVGHRVTGPDRLFWAA